MANLHLPTLPRPFPRCELTDDEWDALPVSVVSTASLIPSQNDVSLYHLIPLLNCPDAEVGRAIRWQDNLYLYDGHHRWVVAAAKGQATFKVRIHEEPTDD